MRVAPIGAALAALCMALPLLADNTVPVGGYATFTVQTGPFSDCLLTGTVTTSNPKVATVTPSGSFSPMGPSQQFQVSAIGVGTAVITVNYTGNPSQYCSSGTFVYNVTVTATAPATPTSAQTTNSGGAGEPISTATGELYGQDETPDLTVSGPLPVTFQRYYASFLSSNNVSSGLGTNWMHNYDVKIAVSGATAKVTLFRGKTVQFTQSGSAWTLSGTEQRPYQLIASGSGYQFLEPQVNLIYTFNSAGALTSIQDRNGNTLTVTQGSNGPTQVSDGLGRTLTFTYSGSNLTSVLDQSARSVTFEYNGGLLSAFANANGKRTTFSYTTAGTLTGLMTSSTRPAGNQPFTQQFDSQGRVTSQSDSFSNSMTLTYSASGTAVSEPGGLSLTQAHDSQFNLTSEADSNGVKSGYTYDANNRPVSSVNRLGATSSVTWDSASGLPSVYTDELGYTTRYSYASSNFGGFTFYDLSGVTYADGTSVKIARDTKGNMTAYTDQAGAVRQYAVNARGQVTSVTNPSGGATTMTYADDGTLTAIQRPSGGATQRAYDSAKRVNQLTFPDGTTQNFQYDGLDNLVTFTDENRHSRAQAFDDNDNLKSTTDALSATTSLSYDTDDRQVSTVDPLGKTTRSAWDALSRLQSVTDPTGVSVNFSYDGLNRLTGMVDTTGKGLNFNSDAEGRLISSTDALQRLIQFSRDARGQITTITTPNGELYHRAYDAMQRLTSVTDPLNRTTHYSYDARGSLIGVNLPGNVTAFFTRSGSGSISSITDPNGNQWTSSYHSSGRPSAVTDPLGQSTSFQYDSRQRLSSATLPAGSAQYSYDAVGNLTALTYSDGTSLAYSYDADNRSTGGSGVTLSRDGNGRITASNGLQIAWDDAGRIAAVTYAPGKTVKYLYDNRGLLNQVSDWVGGVTAFTYDVAHQLTSILFANGIEEDYTYDKDGRRSTIRVSKSGTTISSIVLHRDAAGQIKSADRSAPTVPSLTDSYTPLAYDSADQSEAAAYDSLGRVTGDYLRTYSWDLASRLVSWKALSTTATFTYDAFGQRISKNVNGAAENYILNYALPLPSLAAVRSGGADQRYYIWLPDGKLLQAIDASNNNRHFYHFNESGSTDFLTDDTGAVTDSYATTPYGETVVQNGSTPNPFTFHGAFGVMQEDAAGLYYMRQRYYDSASARFLSRDPNSSLDPRTIAPYQFVEGNPMEHQDPSGREDTSSLNPPDIATDADWVNAAASEFFSGQTYLRLLSYRDKKKEEQAMSWLARPLSGWLPLRGSSAPVSTPPLPGSPMPPAAPGPAAPPTAPAPAAPAPTTPAPQPAPAPDSANPPTPPPPPSSPGPVAVNPEGAAGTEAELARLNLQLKHEKGQAGGGFLAIAATVAVFLLLL